LFGHLNEIWPLVVLPDGRLVYGSFDKTIKIWSTTNASLIKTLKDQTKLFSTFAI